MVYSSADQLVIRVLSNEFPSSFYNCLSTNQSVRNHLVVNEEIIYGGCEIDE